MKTASAANHSGRRYSPFDRLLLRAQHGLRAAVPPSAAAGTAAYPGAPVAEAGLDEGARTRAAGLMRVNHAGEVSAQALYRGQALVAREARIRVQLLKAAEEERAHLAWCAQRLRELGSAPSRLDPLWYAGSFAIGAAAGLAGDRWNLGFVAETERQVEAHLGEHLERLPADDARSRAVVRAMKADEARHGEEAQAAGARALPAPVRRVMALAAGVMKFGAYRL